MFFHLEKAEMEIKRERGKFLMMKNLYDCIAVATCKSNEKASPRQSLMACVCVY